MARFDFEAERRNAQLRAAMRLVERSRARLEERKAESLVAHGFSPEWRKPSELDARHVEVSMLRTGHYDGGTVVITGRDSAGLPNRWAVLNGDAGRRAAKGPHSFTLPAVGRKPQIHRSAPVPNAIVR